MDDSDEREVSPNAILNAIRSLMTSKACPYIYGRERWQPGSCEESYNEGTDSSSAL